MITAKELREATLRGEGPLAKAQEDEPVFLLRAQDKHAADLVEKWATWVSVDVPNCGDRSMHNKVQEAMLIADFMRRWHTHKAPD